MIQILVDRGNAPSYTGIGIFSELLLRSLGEYCSADVNASEAGVSWVSPTLRPLRRAAYLYRLQRLRRAGFRGAEVIHFTNQYAPARSPGTAYAVSIHDLDPILMPSAHTARFTMYFKATISKTIERAHVVITQSNAVRDELVSYFRLAPEK